jgi:hypothetical protein
MIFFQTKLGLLSNDSIDSCTSDLNDTLLFRNLVFAADLTKIQSSTMTKSFFKISNVNASPTLSANPTKYPGLSVISDH